MPAHQVVSRSEGNNEGQHDGSEREADTDGDSSDDMADKLGDEDDEDESDNDVQLKDGPEDPKDVPAGAAEIDDDRTLELSEENTTAMFPPTPKSLSRVPSLEDLVSPALPLGLTRREGWSNFCDYDVITVHGIRDDTKTAWTSKDSGSSFYSQGWIQEDLFRGLDIRQLDYAYDIEESARIYHADGNGIEMESRILLDDVARWRAHLPETEHERPIIWICHDIGGSILKQALINSIHHQPPEMEIVCPSDSEDQPGRTVDLRNVYRKLPLLSSTIIFLGCPHRSQSFEDLEDQLHALLHLPGPGPPVRRRILQKVSNLARQIEKINMEFLETKMLDRAVIINVFSLPDKEPFSDKPEEHGPAHELQPLEQPVEAEQQSERRLNAPSDDPSPTSFTPFSRYSCSGFHNFEVSCRARLASGDHLGLVRGSNPSDAFDWVGYFQPKLNEYDGITIKNSYEFLKFQRSLLSLAPPTRISRFDQDPEAKPPLISWIIEHDAFQELHKKPGPQTVYIHAGLQGAQAVDMKAITEKLYIAYEYVKDEDIGPTGTGGQPGEAAFYFEFDRNDSRRSSIEAMVTSYICAFACRFWYNEEHEVRWSAEYLAVFRCWSLEDLVVLFLNAHEANSMKNVTVILGQFDQCDEAGRQVFLAALRRRQSYNEIDFKLVITTNRPEESISEVLPPGCSISLDDCPLPLEEYLRYPRSNGAIDDKVQSLLSWRPELAQVRPQIRYILEKFVDNHKLQEIFMGFLANYKRGCSSDDAVKIIQEISSIENHSVLQAFISSLSGEKQHWAKQVYSWVKHAAEPLTVEILAQAIQMSTSPGGTKFTGIGYDEFYDDVQQSLRGIVVRDGLEVSFSDEVFYQLPGIGTYRTTDETQQQTYRAHADMAAVCLRYLLSPEGQAMLTSLSVENQGIEDPEGSLLMLPRNSLVSYALRFWMVHYRASGDHRPIDLVRELFQDRDKRQTWAEAHYVTSNPFTRIQREYLSPLPYMSMFGFDECVLEQIETEKQSEGWTKTCWLAITEAARSGHSKTVSLLLDHTVVDFAGLREALQWAANYGRGGALDMLTAKAREIEGFQWPQYILHRAAVAGLENLISALIDAGHDVNEMDATGKRRAIHAAVGSGHDRVVKLLLDSGRVDITLLNYVNDSPLMLAVALGSPETLELLIAAGASLDVYDNLGSPPLRAAIDYAQHKAVGILIDAQVSSDRGDINVINNERDEPMVPIVEAANNGFRECTRVLIDKGADVNKYARYGNALVQAVVGGPYIDICRMLLENGANPNQSLTDHSSYENRENLFLQAISTGDKPLVALMLDHGANVNFADPARTECVTPLSYAATFRGRAHEMMDLLLERGADPNLVPEDKPESRSPLFSAAFSGADPRCVEMLINHGADVHWRRKSDRWSVLHSAYDLPDMLSVLLEHGADVNATDEDNWSTLTLAARWNCTKSLEVLLNQKNPKADLEVQTQGGDVSGGTALTRACQHGHVDAAKLLLEAGANINHKQSDGSFALGLFLRECPQEEACVDIVETALKYNADLSLTDDKGNTVLHHITNSTPFSVVRRLVEEGAPVSAVNDAGYNSLAWAVSCNNVDAARYLITVKGVRADIYHPSFGSILHMAVKDPSVDLVRQLIKAGADHSVVDPEFGETVLCSAVRNGNWRAREKIIRYLVGEVGVDVNGAGGEWGNALLQLVAERPEIPLVKYLLRHGARPTPDAVDRLGRTPAHWAAGGPVQAVNGISGIVKILFKAGFDFTVRDYYGRTPLHFAAASCDLNETRYLLKRLSEDAKDFDINIADVDGWTPLMWACRRTRTFPEDLKEVARLLIDEYGADIYARSTNGEWSPRKVARFCVSYNTDAITEVLLPAEDGQKRRGSDGEEETLDLQIQPGEWHYELCVGCGLSCVGALWQCSDCSEPAVLCFKCIAHSKTMHNPEHTFRVKKDEFEHGEGRSEEADHSENASDEGDRTRGAESESPGTPAEERDESEEDEDESEEEEEDDTVEVGMDEG